MKNVEQRVEHSAILTMVQEQSMLGFNNMVQDKWNS